MSGNTMVARGLTMGDGTSYPFLSLTLPAVTSRQTVVDRIGGGGTFGGPDVAEVGTLSAEVAVVGTTSVDALTKLSALSAAWAPSGVDTIEELAVSIEGVSRVYRGRPRSLEPDTSWLYEAQLAQALCTFTVVDPFWYSSSIKSVTLTVGGASGGMVTPMVTPMVTTGSGSSGDMIVTNDGTESAPWTATLVGPLTTPRLILGGNLLEFAGTVPAGSTLAVDSRTGSVRLDGAARPWVTFVSRWFDIPPGSSTLSLRAAAGTGSATVTWRDANI